MGPRTADDLHTLFGLDRWPLARHCARRRRKSERRWRQAPGEDRRRYAAEIVNEFTPEKWPERPETEASIKKSRKSPVAEMAGEEGGSHLDPKHSAMDDMAGVTAAMIDHLARIDG